VEFDSFDEARSYYFSELYQTAKAKREGAAIAEFVLVEGVWRGSFRLPGLRPKPDERTGGPTEAVTAEHRTLGLNLSAAVIFTRRRRRPRAPERLRLPLTLHA
jgi:hypothetical protein